MPIQSRQRGNWFRLSAPISQTNRARGNRRLSWRSVSAVYRVPKAASIAVAITRRPSASFAALASRAPSFAMPRAGFNGLPGDTISQT